MKTLEQKTEISATKLIARTVTITLIVMGVIASASIDFQATLNLLAQ